MAQLQRAEGETQLKCDADKFFDVWARKTFLVSKMCPQKFPKIELKNGSCWDKVNSVYVWNYAICDIGEEAIVKTRVEEIDEENRLVRYSYHGGLIMKKYYKTLKSKIQATPNCEGCIVKWTFEYEKMKEDAPDPNMYIDFLLATARDIGACLCDA